MKRPGTLPIELRAARMDDAAAIVSIYNQAVEKTTATFDTEPRTLDAQKRWLEAHGDRWPVLVAEQAGRVEGWASLSRWSDRCAYDESAEDSVYVHERARGRGIGKALLEALLAEAEVKKFHTVLARIAEGNPVSVKLHKDFGFKSVGTLKEVGFKFGKRLDVDILQLLL